MSTTGIEAAALSTDRRQFWPRFVAPAILAPALWYLLVMLAAPDMVVAFYVVSIGAAPVLAAAVLLPGWRLARAMLAGTAGRRWQAPLVAVLMLPSLAVALWGLFCLFWLILLLLQGEF